MGQQLEERLEISGFRFKTGDTKLEVRKLVFSVCLLLSDCGNEDKSFNPCDYSFFNHKMKLCLLPARFGSTGTDHSNLDVAGPVGGGKQNTEGESRAEQWGDEARQSQIFSN